MLRACACACAGVVWCAHLSPNKFDKGKESSPGMDLREIMF